VVWLLKFCRTVCGKDVNVFVVLNFLVALRRQILCSTHFVFRHARTITKGYF
jgi:hypothetical protein